MFHKIEQICILKHFFCVEVYQHKFGSLVRNEIINVLCFRDNPVWQML
jgi:hypothetical protein